MKTVQRIMIGVVAIGMFMGGPLAMTFAQDTGTPATAPGGKGELHRDHKELRQDRKERREARRKLHTDMKNGVGEDQIKADRQALREKRKEMRHDRRELRSDRMEKRREHRRANHEGMKKRREYRHNQGKIAAPSATEPTAAPDAAAVAQ